MNFVDCPSRGDEGSVYTGTDPFGTGTKLVRIRHVFTWDLVGPVRIRICYLVPNGSTFSMTPYRSVQLQFRTGPV